MEERKLYCDTEFKENLKNWLFLEQSYKNDESYRVEENLYKFATGETKKQYKERLKRSFIDNFVKWGIEKYQNFIFGLEPTLKYKNNFMEEFLKNFDVDNRNIKEFRTELLKDLLLYGSTAILIDNPTDINLYPNYEIIINDKKFPILKILKRTEIVNIRMKNSELQGVLFFEEKEIADSVFEEPKIFLVFYLYTKEKIIKFKPIQQRNIKLNDYNFGTFEIEIETTNNLNEVPILIYDYKNSFLEVAEKQKIVYNLNSAKLETIYKQNFSPLIISGKMNKNEGFTAGSIIEISPEAKFIPTRLTPPIQAIEEYSKQIDEEKQSIIKLLFPYLLKENFSNATATEKMIDFSDTRVTLEKLACFLEEIENEIWQYIKKIAPYFEDVTVQYNKDYDLNNLENDIMLKDFIFNLQVGLEAEKSLKKYFVSKYYKKIDVTAIDDILKEIDTQKETDIDIQDLFSQNLIENKKENINEDIDKEE